MITKTLFTASIQCVKLAHIQHHQPQKLSKDSLGVEFRKKQGTKVGELAKKLFPEGIDLSQKTDEEKVHLTEVRPVATFEAAAKYSDLFARADILIPYKDNTYTIIEVKSDTSIKPEHMYDVSFQYYVFTKAGYTIKDVKIAYANNEYIKEGEIDPQKYFIIEDITDKLIDVDTHIEHLRNTLQSTEPHIPIGRHCTTPYECPYKHHCWKFLPKNNVTQFFFDKKLGFELLEKGITEIKDIPSDIKHTGRGKTQREIQIHATKINQTHQNTQKIKEWLDTLTYPLYYFDFETYAPAIPLFNNSRPWQRIPFQYSVHIEHEDGTIEHKEFLATTKDDPREALINQMINDLGDKGSIVVFNQTFEKSVVKELMRDFPYFAAKGEQFLARIVDLAKPFQDFDYYNPEQMGRYSIKVILPLFSDASYKGLAIANGEDAFCAYEEILAGNLEQVQALKEYCKLDTFAEIEIVKKLRSIALDFPA